MQDKFGLSFQLDLIRLILNDLKFSILVSQHLKSSFFTSKHLRLIYDFIVRFIDKYQSRPDINSLKHHFRGDSIVLGLIKKLNEDRIIKSDYVRDELEEFIKRSRFIKIYNEAGQLYNEDRIKDSFEIMSDGMEKINSIDLSADSYTYLLKDFDVRMNDRMYNKESINDFRISTGIGSLDKFMQGGLGGGEVGLIIGDAKSGKTTFLRYLGLAAVRRYYPVLHIQCEDTRDKCETGYDSALMRKSFYDIRNGKFNNDEIKRVLLDWKTRKKKDLVIKAYTEWDSCNVQNIDDVYADLYHQGVIIKEVIVDYIDLLKAMRIYEQERFRQTSIIRDLKSFSMRRNVAVWAATQTFRNIDDDDPNFIITGKDVAEDYNKIRVADLAISINHTKSEYARGFCRTALLPGRLVKGYKIIRHRQDLKHGLYYIKG